MHFAETEMQERAKPRVRLASSLQSARSDQRHFRLPALVPMRAIWWPIVLALGCEPRSVVAYNFLSPSPPPSPPVLPLPPSPPSPDFDTAWKHTQPGSQRTNQEIGPTDAALWLTSWIGDAVGSLVAGLIFAICCVCSWRCKRSSMLQFNSSATPAAETDTAAVPCVAVPVMQGTSPPTAAEEAAIVAQKLATLKALLDLSVISQAEHDSKRADLIASL